MAIIAINDFRSMSEFGQYNGDCLFAAMLPLLHCIDETAFPLGFATLDRLVSEAHAGGFCEANGAINVPNASRWLSWLPWTDHFGVAHTGVAHSTFCSYGTPGAGETGTWHPFALDNAPGSFHAVLKAAAGVLGVVFERSAGVALPGDEAGVVYHYIAAGGVDTGAAGDGVGGAYLCADGDNSANPRDGAPRAAIRYTWAQIAAANPIGAIRINEPMTYNPGAGVPAPTPIPVPAPVPNAQPLPASKVVTITLTPEQVAAIKAS